MKRARMVDVKRVLLVLLGLAWALPAAAQEPASPVTVPIPDRWLQGFSRPITGERLVYPWAYPGQATALLTRTTTGRMRIEWEGEVLPPGVTDERVTYIWHAGLASGYGAHHFALSVNDTPCAVFTSGRDTRDREWTLQGSNGCTLAFKTTRVGTFNELFGLMLLTAPRQLLAGAAPRFVVVGEPANNSDYYMTFQEPVRAWTRASAEQARFKDGSPIVSVEASRVANAAPMVIRAGGETLWRGMAGPGHTAVMVKAPARASQLALVVEIDGAVALSQQVALPAVRQWEIHLLPHSHVDVGYSDPQPVVEQKQWKNLRDAVDLAVKTRNYPADARFKWNVEGLWSVESYLKQAPRAELDAFATAVKDGSIDLQANYTNVLTGLSTPEELEHWTDGARRLQAAYGFGSMRTAMHTDIPGISWTAVRALAHGGVRYFSSGPNYMPGSPDGGDRIGRTLKALGDRPFWWQSPSGEERVLFWMAGRGYSWFHGLNLGRLETAGRQAFLDYVRQLAADGYPYDMVQVRYTIGGDNGPVDGRLPDFVKAWNESFDTPRLVIDTASAMFTEFERRYGDRLPTRAGDMTPYWEDGAVSSAGEEALTRAAARRLQQAAALWALRDPMHYPLPAFGDAWRDVTMWHEHTWGAADSISQPDRKDVVEQWLYKRAFAVRADERSRELLEAATPRSGQAIEVINTLSWPRDGLVVVDGKEARGRAGAKDAAGRRLPSQRLADGRLAVWLAGVPALGATRVTLSAGAPARPQKPVTASPTSLDNGHIRLVVDQATGDIRSLRSAGAGDTDFAGGSTGLNAYRYVAGLDPGGAAPAGPARIVVEEPGPLVGTLRIESEAPGARRLVRRVTLVADDERVWLETVLDKSKVRTKESAHLAFPFHLPADSIVRVDEGEALVTLERDQLPGSCRDFVGVSSAIDVSSEAVGVSVASQDAPLVEPGALTDERRSGDAPRAWRETVAAGPSLYAYLLNNYWHTNYKADQEGRITFRFVLQPHGAFDPAALHRLSAEVDQPLVPARAVSSAPAVPPPFQVESQAAVMSALVPMASGLGLQVRLYNPTPTETSARLTHLWKGRTVTLAAPGDRRTVGPAEALTLKPFASLVLEVRRTEAK